METSPSFHIFTVGTSILANYARAANGEDLELLGSLGIDIGQMKRTGALGDIGWNDYESLLREETRRSDVRRFVESLARFVGEYPRRASAELNAFYGIIGNTENLRHVSVVLLYTRTPEGVLAARVLDLHLSSRGVRVETRPVEGYSSPQEFPQGLYNLVKALLDTLGDIEKSNPRAKVLVNATGGFKPETAFTTLVSFLHPMVDAVYYISERFRVPVILPRIALKLDTGWLCSLLSLEGLDKPTAREVTNYSPELEPLEHLQELGLVTETEDAKIRVADWVKHLASAMGVLKQCKPKEKVG